MQSLEKWLSIHEKGLAEDCEDKSVAAAWKRSKALNIDYERALPKELTAGELGEKTVTAAADGGTEVMLGDPFKFDPENIAEWKEVY